MNNLLIALAFCVFPIAQLTVMIDPLSTFHDFLLSPENHLTIMWLLSFQYFVHADVEIHQDIKKNFWDPEHWPKHVLVRYTWLVYSMQFFLIYQKVFHLKDGQRFRNVCEESCF